MFTRVVESWGVVRAPRMQNAALKGGRLQFEGLLSQGSTFGGELNTGLVTDNHFSQIQPESIMADLEGIGR